MTIKEKYNELIKYLDELKQYNTALAVMNFDFETIVPKNGASYEGEAIAFLSKKAFELSKNPHFIELFEDLYQKKSSLTKYQARLVTLLHRDYQKSKNIDPDFFYQVRLSSNNAYQAWLDAREKNDFNLFKDALNQVVENTKKSVLLRDEQKSSVYDSLLDDFEVGNSIEKLDALFDKFKKEILPLINNLKEKDNFNNDFIYCKVSKEKQIKFNQFLMKTIGLDQDSSYLCETEHPFTSEISEGDVRITTHYYENDCFSNIFSVLHEGGHALYGLYEGKKNHDEHIDGSMSMGSHECMSRLMENIVGRNKNFVHFLYPKIKKYFSEFKNISESDLYKAINLAKPSYIRVDADELTYCVHIIIRYELERDLFNGKITIDEIKDEWNKKYHDYLGLDYPDDRNGILQDVHWTDTFGYFPSYALGNFYSAQIMHYMKKDFDVDEALSKGLVYKVRDWLKRHAYPYGSLYDPDEWIKKVTGEELNINYYIEYLKDKFQQ